MFKKIFPLALRWIIAVILFQTLFFKFTGDPESVHIFTTLGLEPVGRIGTGIAELIAGILVLISSTAWLGALLSLGLMGGAIMSHLAQLGIEVQGDGGFLFCLAVIVFVSSLITLWYQRAHIPFIGSRFK